jgi:hypothetical protein
MVGELVISEVDFKSFSGVTNTTAVLERAELEKD